MTRGNITVTEGYDDTEIGVRQAEIERYVTDKYNQLDANVGDIGTALDYIKNIQDYFINGELDARISLALDNTLKNQNDLIGDSTV